MENEKKLYIVDNKLQKDIGLEIYYYSCAEIKCDGMVLESKHMTKLINYDIYKISIFYEGRFHDFTCELLHKKIRKIEFPFMILNIDYNDTNWKITIISVINT